MKLKGYFPLRPVVGIDTDFYNSTRNQLLHYLGTTRQFCVRGADLHSGTALRVSVVPVDDDLKHAFPEREPQNGKINFAIHLEGDFEYPGEDKLGINEEYRETFTGTKAYEFWLDILPEVVDVSSQAYLCALMVAFPGAADVCGGAWFCDGVQQNHKSHYKAAIRDAVDFLVENGIEPRSGMDPKRVADWVFAQNGMLTGYSDTPASRALNYFTYLFAEGRFNDLFSDLVWALAGIEALLVEGGRSSLGQLREKLPAALVFRADHEWFERKLRNMYDYRSRMVHGDRQMRSAFRGNEMETDKRFDEEDDSSRLAVGLLLLLLQECAARQVSKLEFKTILLP
jgi:hypothetical protein